MMMGDEMRKKTGRQRERERVLSPMLADDDDDDRTAKKGLSRDSFQESQAVDGSVRGCSVGKLLHCWAAVCCC